jgi:protein-tyrosine-phosphatase
MDKQKKIKQKNTLNLLFVCYGNICRSPMAEAIARKLLDEGVHSESAGIAAYSENPASAEAVVAIFEDYSIDISGHRARHVSEVPLENFDFIFALDSLVYQYLRKLDKIPPDKLIQWDIDDPVGLPKVAFKQVARKLESNLEQFLTNREIE